MLLHVLRNTGHTSSRVLRLQSVRMASTSTTTYGPDKLSAEDYGKKHLTSGLGRIKNWTMAKGEGLWLFDQHNNKFLDFTSGIGVASTGHCHPTVAKAVAAQVSKLVHAQVNIGFHEPMLQLIEKLIPVCPKGLETFFFWTSGSEAVEAAVKVARYFTKKDNILVVQGGYHGRTYGTMAMTTSKTIYRAGFGPVMPGVFVLPYPYETQVSGMAADKLEGYCIDQLQLMLKQQSAPSDTAALVIEPVLGEGGYVFPPQNYLKEVKRICTENNILFIADEVQSGFGRTGKMFACEHFDVVPDILIMAKGIASGYPLSAIVGRNEIMTCLAPGSMGGTYGGNAVSCAAAIATMQVFEEENILANVVARGEQLKRGLLNIAKKYPNSHVKDVRGKGLMVGMEFDQAKWKGSGICSKVTSECGNRGLLLLTTSVFETIRFIPALTVNESEVNQCLAIVDQTFATLFKN